MNGYARLAFVLSTAAALMSMGFGHDEAMSIANDIQTVEEADRMIADIAAAEDTIDRIMAEEEAKDTDDLLIAA